MKKQIGILLLIISVFFVVDEIRLTGNFINTLNNFSFINYLGILFFIVSLIIITTSKKSLEILAIPGGESKWRQPRLIAAVKEKRNTKFDNIYEMNGADSEEDILLLGEKIKQGDKITFDTFPTHYKEYLELAQKAQRDGKFPKKVKFRNLEINEDMHSKLYGLLGLLEEKIKRRPLAYLKDRKETYLPKIKKFVHKFI